MIVKCEQCQTRFKIPDDKVTDKGVKVRCTKCGNTFRVTRDSASSPSGISSASPAATGQFVAATGAFPPVPEAPDPFTRFASPSEPPADEQTRPGVFSLGVEASKIPSLAPPAAAPARAVAAAPPPPAVPAPFDFASMGQQGPPAPAAANAPFDFSAAAPAAAPAPAPAPFDFGAAAGPAAGAAPADLPNFDFSPQPPAAAPKSSAADADFPAFDFSGAGGGAAPMSSAPALLDVPDLGPGFIAVESAGTPGAASDADKSALFDLPKPEAAAPVLPPPDPEDYDPPAVSGPSRAASSALGHGGGHAGDPSGDLLDDRRHQRRKAVGIVVNVALAFFLVVALVLVMTAYGNEGRLDARAFSPERIGALLGAGTDFVANDISNGLYETRRGKPVFFVRGEVKNRTTSAARIRVRAELLEGAKLVRTGQSLAGASATPEELHDIASGEDVQRLAAKHAESVKPVEPGASAPFVIVFVEYPPDLKAFRVRVVAEAEGGGPQAQR